MKKAWVLFAGILIIGLGGFLLFLRTETPPADVIAINDAVISALQSGGEEEAPETVIRQILLEIEKRDAAEKGRDRTLFIFLCAYSVLFAAAGALLYLSCYRSILAPFRKLQGFARNVAAGDLDFPLEMEGRFGAFTESFDLMREELQTARENERNADRSKKELVASLSHDIKTPVASIKAAAELMSLSARDEKDRTQLARIGEKAEQINTLITDMFHATLEELQELSVTVSEVQSTLLPRLLRNADYKGFLSPFTIPNCIVLADPVRLQQIFDNVIGNSYKYAGTAMEVSASFEENTLVLEIIDFGPGVPEVDLPIILNKFTRGKNAEDKSGYGLGLFIANTLAEGMSGGLRCENRSGGFAVILSLRLAGS